jgi:hypothetical protein
LYDVDPSNFVIKRKALAGTLRAQGGADDARELTRARRPTRAAWALNQVSRRAPIIIERLLLSANDLQAAQNAALAGQRDTLRDATRAHRAAIIAASEAAAAVLGDGASEPVMAKIAETLQAVAADEAAAELLRRGRLTRDVVASSGFTTTRDARAIRPDRRDAGAAATGSAPVDEVAERRRQLEGQLAVAEAAHRLADEAVTAAEHQVLNANRRVERQRADLDDAQRDAHSANRALREARRLAATKAKEVDRLRRTPTR